MSRSIRNKSASDPLGEADAAIELDDAQVARWIRRSRRHGGAVWLRRRLTVLIVLAAAVILIIAGRESDPPWRRLLPVAMVTLVMVFSWRFSLEVRRVRLRYGRAMTQMQFRQWPSALASIDELLSSPVDLPDMRAAALMSAAELASRAGRHDAAVEALDEILAGPVSRLYAERALAEKALALLRAERLTEATELLDSFRHMEFPEPTASVAVLGQLYRRIRTRNFAAVAAEADIFAERARLVFHRQAAYVYALVALALLGVDRRDRAQTYYDCATRLMSPEELGRRFAELTMLSEELTPARNPL